MNGHSVSNGRSFLAQTGVSWRVAIQYFQWFTGLLCGFRFRYRKVCRFKSCSSYPLKNRHFAKSAGAVTVSKKPTVTKLCPRSAAHHG